MTEATRDASRSVDSSRLGSRTSEKGRSTHKELREIVDASTSSISREIEERADVVDPCCIESKDPPQRRR